MAATIFGCLGGVAGARKKIRWTRGAHRNGTIRKSQLLTTRKVWLASALKCQGLFLLLSHDFCHVLLAFSEACILFL